jgi:hypothetical protein
MTISAILIPLEEKHYRHMHQLTDATSETLKRLADDRIAVT